MKIVVTGSLGQLGYEMMRQAEDSAHTYVFTDVRESDKTQSLDITDSDAVEAFIGDDVDVIINCAAYTDVNRAEKDEVMALRLNCDAPANLARAALKAGALLIHVSTDYVFDGKGFLPYTEEDTTGPLSAYGRTKLSGEKAVEESGCRYMIFRTAWLYSLTGKNFFLTMARLTDLKPMLKVVYDQVGTPTNATDLASLLGHVIEHDMLDRTGLYHYTNEGVCSWYDFTKEINDLLGHNCNVMPCRTEEFPTPAVRPHYSVLDKKKVRETFGIEVPHWKDSLRRTVKEYVDSSNYYGTV